MHTWQVLLSRVLEGVTYAPEIHRTNMYTEYRYYKQYVIAYEVYKTYMVFENNTPGHPQMEAVVLACRTYACPAVEVVLMIYLTNPNTHPSVDYN